MVSTATAAQTLDAEAFNQLVLEHGLTPWPGVGYLYAGLRGPTGWELYRTVHVSSWDSLPETLDATSDPAAGTLTVDFHTFLRRGIITAVNTTCLADANVATRYLRLRKVSGTAVQDIATGAAFAAAATGSINSMSGYTATQAASYPALSEIAFEAGEIARIVVDGGQAGDNLSVIYFSYREVPA